MKVKKDWTWSKERDELEKNHWDDFITRDQIQERLRLTVRLERIENKGNVRSDEKQAETYARIQVPRIQKGKVPDLVDKRPWRTD